VALNLRLRTVPSDEELLELSERNPGYQFERSAVGDLIVTPTGSESGRLSGEVFGQLRDWNRQSALGVVFDSSGGFRLPDGAVYAPDASWVQRERWEALAPEQRRTFAPLCPDAVFEITSPSDRLADLQEKMSAYMKNGAHLGVLIDPAGRTVEIYRQGQEPRLLADPGIVTLDPELPGFVLDLGPIFAV